ncbi:hypothetical protein [Streptomyces atratus]|nr:hypothetical protein [Streptomyces atratus]MCT2544306.1 hypothetical protein [Streptomyces atratus]
MSSATARVIRLLSTLRHLWQCPACGAYTTRALKPGETCGQC